MNHKDAIFSMCKNRELNYSPSWRYPSYFFNIQTTRITYLSKSINQIKMDEKEEAHSKGRILSVFKKKHCTWKNPRPSLVNPKRYLKSELIKGKKNFLNVTLLYERSTKRTKTRNQRFCNHYLANQDGEKGQTELSPPVFPISTL